MSKTIYEEIEELKSLLQKGSPATQEQAVTSTEFIKRRNAFVVVSVLVSFVFVVASYVYYLPLFSLMFGFFLAIVCVGLVLIFDEYILPGDTIGKISQNAIAAALVIVAFAYIVIGGAEIGNSLITNRVKGEEPTPVIIKEQRTSDNTKQDTTIDYTKER